MLVTPFIVLESMGSLCSREKPYKESDAEGTAQAAEIDRRIAQETKAEHHIHKLLLLGAGESGKSTIFKQIKLLFQTGFDEAELRSYTSVIHANVYQTIKILFDGAEELAQNETESLKYVVSLDNKVIGEKLSEIGSRLGYPHLTKEIAQDIEALWKDAAIQETYARGNILQVPDCAQYFMENLERLSEADYIPTKEDVLCSRVRTSGVAEIQFSPVGENRKSGEVYRLFDVGGQRNERRKWIHLFEGVTAVIFCAAISEYDQTLFEDDSKNRMMETKELFDWVLKQECFEKTSFMLFLNKFDIFEKKVQNVPLNELQVRMDCNGCVQRIKRAMHGLDGVYSVSIDKVQQKLTVVGDVDPAKIVRAIKKTRKIATICSHTDPAVPPPPPPEPAPPAADAAPPPPEPPTVQPEPPKDPPPPETPEPEVVKPTPEPEVHMVHHYPHNYVHKEHWNHEYPSVQAPVYVTHSYNSYQPSQSMSDYGYLRSPPRSTYYGGADHQAYNDGYYHNNRGGRDGNQVSSMFSDENPNACRIV